MEKEFIKEFLTELNKKLSEASDEKECEKIMADAGKHLEEIFELSGRKKDISRFDFLFWLRTDFFYEIIEREKIEVHEEFNVYFLLEMKKSITKPSQLVAFLEIYFPPEIEFNPFSESHFIDLCSEVLGNYISSFTQNPSDQSGVLENEAVKKLPLLLMNWIEQAKLMPVAEKPVMIKEEDGSSKASGTYWHALLLLQSVLWKLSGTLDGVEGVKRSNEMHKQDVSKK